MAAVELFQIRRGRHACESSICLEEKKSARWVRAENNIAQSAAGGYNKVKPRILQVRNQMSIHQSLLEEFSKKAQSLPSTRELMTHISQRLHDQLARYNWVGFYLVDAADPGMLVVGPYVGSFSPNERIPLNKGLCGAAASLRQT